MKRMVAIMAVLMLLVTVVIPPCAAIADDSREEYWKGVQEYVVSMLDGLSKIHSIGRDTFDADYILMTYSYLMEYLAVRRLIDLESSWFYKDYYEDGTVFRDGMPDYLPGEQSFVGVEQKIGERFSGWVDGEESDEDFADFMMNLIRSMILEEETAE